MLSLKYRGNVKVAFLALAVALMLVTEPVLAKKGRKADAKPSRGSQKTQRVTKSSSVPKPRSPSNVGKSRTRTFAASRSIRSGPKANASTARRQITSGRNIRSSFRQTRRTGLNRLTMQKPRTTFSTSKPTWKRPSSGLSSSSGISFGRKGPARTSSIRRIVGVAGSDGSISWENTSRIGDSIGVKESAAGVTGEVTRARRSQARAGKVGQSSSGGIQRRTQLSVDRSGKGTEAGRERIGRAIKADKAERVDTSRKGARDSKPKAHTAGKAEGNSSRVLTESRPIVKKSERGAEVGRKGYRVSAQSGSRLNNRTSFRKSSLFVRPSWERSQHVRPGREKSQHFRIGSRRVFAHSRPGTSRPGKVIGGRRRHRFGRERPSSVRYRERGDAVSHIRHHEHVYIDRHDRIRRRTAWPRYRFAVYYNWGPHFAFRYFYPYYHRKYVFVSLGGYWPVGYRYTRYYWYGCHPYTWYGYYPIAREVAGDTYNYYTYNYYGDTAGEPCQSTSGIQPVDHTTFADVRARLAQEAAGEPDAVSMADKYFEDAVKVFEAGDYDLAAEMFAKSIELAPDDIILPFAYCQALFAAQRYTEAAEVLRSALAKVSPEAEGVFYPRGLYAKDALLFEQIDRLAEKTELYSFDGDLQLLLGYQLLGISEIDEAVEPLRLASQDLRNASSAAVLLDLLEKIRIQNTDDTD